MPKRERKGENGMGMLGALEGAPWYVKTVIFLLAWFGFPVAVSAFLLMVVIGYIPSPLTTLDKNMSVHMKDMETALTTAANTNRLMRQICINTSKDAVERIECNR